MDSPQRICLTPTRNESWIIDPFLAATRTWADRVIVADQGSTDGTWEKLQSAPKVDAVVNDSPTYDEAYRQRLLIGKARQIQGKRILIALDADEALSANFRDSAEWKLIEDAKPGTVLRFRWINILPGFEKAWIPDDFTAFGFVDDGSDHTGDRIHSRRIPWPKDAPVLDLHEIAVLHFQYVAWDRVVSKHRWYQAWETINDPARKPLDIFRQYHHMYGSWSPSEIHPIKPEWLSTYDRAGIDFRSLKSEPVTWWDRELLRMLSDHGAKRFRKIAMWDADWRAIAKRVGINGDSFSDPRSIVEQFAHRLLTATQKNRANWGVRAFEKLLRATGW